MGSGTARRTAAGGYVSDMADGIRRRGADLSTSGSGGGAWAPLDSGSTSTSSTFASYSDMATVDVRDRTSEFREACRAAQAKRTTPGARSVHRHRPGGRAAAPLIGRCVACVRSPPHPGAAAVGVHVGRRRDRQRDQVDGGKA